MKKKRFVNMKKNLMEVDRIRNRVLTYEKWVFAAL